MNCHQRGFFSCAFFLFWISFLSLLSFSLLFPWIYHLLYNSFQVLESSESFQLQDLHHLPIMIRNFCINNKLINKLNVKQNEKLIYSGQSLSCTAF